jgi:NAD(P)-dependent dehydrogenase (short-subunit alcohol dehydrogenase family)
MTAPPAGLDSVRRELETNVFGSLATIRELAPVLAANGGGAIVNALSAMSWFGVKVRLQHTIRHGSGPRTMPDRVIETDFYRRRRARRTVSWTWWVPSGGGVVRSRLSLTWTAQSSPSSRATSAGW